MHTSFQRAFKEWIKQQRNQSPTLPVISRRYLQLKWKNTEHFSDNQPEDKNSRTPV